MKKPTKEMERRAGQTLSLEATPATLPVAFCAKAGPHPESVANPKAVRTEALVRAARPFGYGS
jgi:hypothetical protein